MAPRLPHRIAVFVLSGIGDAVLFTPALARLRRAFPDAHITAVTMFTGAADVLGTNTDVDEVRCLAFLDAGPGQAMRWTRELRREGFDLAILGFPANRPGYNLVNAAVGRRWRAGHRYRRQRWRNLTGLNNVVVRETGDRHNVAENLALVDAVCRRFGIPAPATDTRLRVRLTADDRARADALLAEHRVGGDEVLVGVHAYSTRFKNMHRKCWDAAGFAAFGGRVHEVHPRARIVLFSGPSDAAVQDEIVRGAPATTIVVAEPNLRTALGVLRHCRLFVSNDSGLMHLASAIGVPVVALFGPTDWRRLHPWQVPHVVVRDDLPCMPCFEYSSRPLRCTARTDYACMRGIGVDDVLAAARDLLAERAVARA